MLQVRTDQLILLLVIQEIKALPFHIQDRYEQPGTARWFASKDLSKTFH